MKLLSVGEEITKHAARGQIFMGTILEIWSDGRVMAQGQYYTSAGLAAGSTPGGTLSNQKEN